MHSLPIISEQVTEPALVKMLKQGKKSLSDNELLSIILHKQLDSAQTNKISGELLNSYEGKLLRIAKLELPSLTAIAGITPSVGAAIVAAFELGARREDERNLVPKRINSSNEAYLLVKRLLIDLEVEHSWVVLLDSGNEIIHKFKLSEGGLSSTIVDVRLVFKLALRYNAIGLILYHNHPSGRFEPSQADIDVTHRFQQVGIILDILVVDHIIVGENGYFSFADRDLMMSSTYPSKEN